MARTTKAHTTKNGGMNTAQLRVAGWSKAKIAQEMARRRTQGRAEARAKRLEDHKNRLAALARNRSAGDRAEKAAGNIDITIAPGAAAHLRSLPEIADPVLRDAALRAGVAEADMEDIELKLADATIVSLLAQAPVERLCEAIDQRGERRAALAILGSDMDAHYTRMLANSAKELAAENETTDQLRKHITILDHQIETVRLAVSPKWTQE